MTRLFRSKSCGASSMFNPSPPPYDQDQEDEDEEEDYSPVTTPLISPERRYKQQQQSQSQNQSQNQQQFQILDVLFAVLRKSLVTCSVETEDMSSAMDIGWPTDVRHVSHVTFDRFNGFLGLPVELEPELPRKVPSASVRVFGVSANSMQCSFDQRGNSVPTILLMMQDRLYSEGGLQAEGIFRINAENSQEEGVRNQLNKGVVPHGIDVHCLAGLIKAWFRELPAGVLDCLTPEQVMHCNTEEECTQLLKLLPATESALLDWAINLMADVVQHENYNKMNARNIAMVFAPNMTQMADPLTALIHAVQVMNFLKTLIVKTLREREESTPQFTPQPSRKDSPINKEDSHSSSNTITLLSRGEAFDSQRNNKTSISNLFRSATFNNVESDNMEKFWCFQDKKDSVPDRSTTPGNMGSGLRSEYGSAEGEGILDKLKLKRGVLKLCRHPVFQLSKSIKKETVGL